MQQKRHFWLFTLANHTRHHEVVYRTGVMEITQRDLINVKETGAAQFGVATEQAAIVNSIYLGYMEESYFTAGFEVVGEVEPNGQS